MNYLLDTNVVSEDRNLCGSTHVKEWMDTVPGSSLFVSVIVVGELRRGVDLLFRRDRLHGLMAATAKVHRMTFVTRDVGRLAESGVAVLNPVRASSLNVNP